MSNVPVYLKGRGRGRGNVGNIKDNQLDAGPGRGRGAANRSAGYVGQKSGAGVAHSVPSAEERFQSASEQYQESIKRHLGENGDAGADNSSDEEDLDTNVLEKVFQSYSTTQGEDAGIGEAQDTLLHSFRSGTSACLVCIDSIKKNDPIWSCEGCYAIFHIQCIQKWVKDGVYQQIYKSDDDNIRPEDIPWNCPKCRMEYSQRACPTRYLCYCGKVVEPQFDPWLVPHSCGQTCGRPLKPDCGHACLLLCHPGGCPPCPKTLRVMCHCGNATPQVRRCSARAWACGGVCGKKLSCGQHTCQQSCHPDECAPCPKTSSQKCRCGKTTSVRPCASPQWQCDKICGKRLSCGNHVCEIMCHSGSCGDCPRGGERKCPCGKTAFLKRKRLQKTLTAFEADIEWITDEVSNCSKAEGDEDEGDKKKKKKKKGEKEEKPKKSKAPVGAIKALLQKQKEEEERLMREEEERIQKEEEAIAAAIEKKRVEEEKRQRKRDKERERKERLKAEGKLLTAQQKQDKIRLQQMLASREAQGVEIPVKEEVKKKRPVYEKKKKRPPQKQNDTVTTEQTPSPDETPVQTPVTDEAKPLDMPSDTAPDDKPADEQVKAYISDDEAEHSQFTQPEGTRIEHACSEETRLVNEHTQPSQNDSYISDDEAEHSQFTQPEGTRIEHACSEETRLVNEHTQPSQNDSYISDDEAEHSQFTQPEGTRIEHACYEHTQPSQNDSYISDDEAEHSQFTQPEGTRIEHACSEETRLVNEHTQPSQNDSYISDDEAEHSQFTQPEGTRIEHACSEETRLVNEHTQPSQNDYWLESDLDISDCDDRDSDYVPPSCSDDEDDTGLEKRCLSQLKVAADKSQNIKQTSSLNHCVEDPLRYVAVDSLDTNCAFGYDSDENDSLKETFSELALKKLEEDQIVRDLTFPKIFIRKHIKTTKMSSSQPRKRTTDRIYNNYHACFYCSRFVQHINTHLKTHQNLAEVREELRKECPDFTQTRKLGDDKNNRKVVEKKEGELVIARRCSSYVLDVQQFGPCTHCREWLLLSGMKKHLRKCLKDSNENVEEVLKDAVLKSMILGGFISAKASKMMTEEVVSTMKRDGVRMIALNDPLIIMLGESWLRRNQDNTEKRRYYASQHMRLVAKLLIELRREEGEKKDQGSTEENLSLWDFLKPSCFDSVVAAALQVSLPQYDDLEDLKSPSNAIKLKYDLRRLVNMKYAYLLKTVQEDRDIADCKGFLELMNMEWAERVTKLARTILQQRKYLENKELPSPEDIEKLSRYLVTELKSVELKADNFSRVSALCQTRLLIYNKRRSGELEVIRLKSYASRKKDLSDLDESIAEDLTKVEKYLLQSQELMTVRGKGGRPVPVIIPLDVKAPLENIASRENRKAACIRKSNKFLFPNSALNYSRAYANLKTICDECSLKAPQRITSVAMRKYTATLTQLMNLDKYQMEWVCRHLGHTKSVHKQAYRQMSGLVERVYVTKLMLVQDLNLTRKFKGQSLEDIDLNDIINGEEGLCETQDVTCATKEVPLPECTEDWSETDSHQCEDEDEPAKKKKKVVRQRWTDIEVSELKRLFTNYLETRTTPATRACEDAKKISRQNKGQIWQRANHLIVKKISNMNHAKH